MYKCIDLFSVFSYSKSDLSMRINSNLTPLFDSATLILGTKNVDYIYNYECILH